MLMIVITDTFSGARHEVVCGGWLVIAASTPKATLETACFDSMVAEDALVTRHHDVVDEGSLP